MIWYWIALGSTITFALEERDGRIAKAAPIARWSVGRPVVDVLRYYRSRGAEVREYGR